LRRRHCPGNASTRQQNAHKTPAAATARTPRFGLQITSHDYKVNQAWLTASMIACILLAWLKLLALDGDLAKAEPKTLRYLL
jgi:hypothetical protein